MNPPSVEACHARYCRLYAESFDQPSADALAKLALAMRRTGVRNNAEGIPSGVVYFGQLIDHDITDDKTPLEARPYPAAEVTRNYRTPLLDLDSIYGEESLGEETSANGHLPGNRAPEHEDKFSLGDTAAVALRGTVLPSSAADLPRRDDHSPLVPDERNDNNLIIAQLHVLFLRFHNKLIDLLERPGSAIPAPPGATLFARAQRLVIWHYQWLVREYFLPLIVLRSVLRDIEKSGPQLFTPGSDEEIALPIEFTMGAFRFGHSMIRDRYLLNKHVAVDAGEILNKEFRRLRADHVLDWNRFVALGRNVNVAQKIDTAISPSLYFLSEHLLAQYKNAVGPGTGDGIPAAELMLPARTLQRGAKAGLPSAQEACARTGGVPFRPLAKSHGHFGVLTETGLIDRLPLWYYILYEAEVAGVDETLSANNRQPGCRLGHLGSRIVAEVLIGLLDADPDSFCRNGWEPPKLPFGTGERKPIKSLRDMVDFVSLAA